MVEGKIAPFPGAVMLQEAGLVFVSKMLLTHSVEKAV
jgi:hypothetical protein